jgi:hypothetical protein
MILKRSRRKPVPTRENKMQKYHFLFEVVNEHNHNRVGKDFGLGRKGIVGIWETNHADAHFKAVKYYAWVSKCKRYQWVVHPLDSNTLHCVNAPNGDHWNFSLELDCVPFQRAYLKQYLPKEQA